MEENENKSAQASALETAGEAAFSAVGSTASTGLAGTLASGVKSALANVKAALKDPKRLLPALILAVVWLILNLLSAAGVNALPVKALSFLTFARAGMSGGVLGAVGGILGKCVFASAVTSAVSLFTNASRLKNLKPQSLLQGISFEKIGCYAAGAGASVWLLWIMSGGFIGRFSFMGGVAAAFLAAKAFLSNGIATRVLSAVGSKGKFSLDDGRAVLQGFTAGFAVAALLGLINANLPLLIVGGVLLAGGTVLIILQKAGILSLSGKGAAAK